MRCICLYKRISTLNFKKFTYFDYKQKSYKIFPDCLSR